MLAMYQAMAEKFGYHKGEISATPQNDILKEMIGRGAWIYPVEPAVRMVGDTIEFAMKALEQGAMAKENVMPYLVDRCRAYATVGEMASVFRDVFGEHTAPGIF
jgi:methylmalonyl-CoA mutase N-terminal domain/subunit